MRISEKYIYKEMSLPVIFGVSLFTFIFLIDVLAEMMESIIVKSVPIWDVMEIISYTFPPVIVQTMPMGILLGVMLTYGSLSGNSEITAMESVGIGFKNFLKPALMVGIIAMLFIFFLEEKIVPNSFQRMQIVKKKIAYKKPTVKLENKMFIENVGNYTIYLNEVDNENNEAKNVIVFNRDSANSAYPQIIIADSAKWFGTSMVMEHGEFFSVNSEGRLNLKGGFEERRIPVSNFFDFSFDDGDSIENMSISAIAKKIADAKKKKMETVDMEVEYQQKLSIPVTSFLLAVLGVLLSVKNRRSGKGVSFGISLVIIFFHYVGIIFGRVLGSSGKVSPFLALWYPNIILLALTVILLAVQIRRR